MKMDKIKIAILEEIFHFLSENEWSIARTAKYLKMNPATVSKYKKQMEKLGWPVQTWERAGKKRGKYILRWQEHKKN
jgi:hypothetical protein